MNISIVPEKMVSIKEAFDYLKSQGFIYVHPEYMIMIRKELWHKKQICSNA